MAFLSLTLLAVSLSQVWMGIVGIAGFVVAFGLAVFVHELGHFLAAKFFGVPVERFVIGFDREAIPGLPGCIWERRIGETVYGVSLIPLGGYVKMSGVVHPDIEAYLDGDGKKPEAGAPAPGAAMRPDGGPQPLPDSATLQGQAMQDMAALYRKPFYQKVVIYGAGVVMNLLLAMCLVAFQSAHGVERGAPLPAKVAWFAADNPLAAIGWQPGDDIRAVAGTPVANDEELSKALAAGLGLSDGTDAAPAETLEMELARAATGEAYTVELAREKIMAEDGKSVVAGFAEIMFRQPAYVEMVIPNDPADKAGMKRGDMIAAIDGAAIEDWAHFRHIVSTSPGKTLEVLVHRAAGEKLLQMTPMENPRTPGAGLVGVMPGNPDKIVEREAVLTAIGHAPGRTLDLTKRYVDNLQRLFGDLVVRQNVNSVRRELGGPVGIAQMAYRQAQEGLSAWIRFVIILNVALAVMNILPFPVLDGGHICFAAYEAVFRKPVSPRFLVPLLNGAVIFILIFFLLVTANDLLKIFA